MRNKYRVWDKKLNRFDDGYWMYQNGHLDHDTKIIDRENLIIQFFTGLKDKNGKEICEGDIINFVLPEGGFHPDEMIEGGIFAVTFSEAAFRLGYMEMPYGKYLEIIGNIFENKELPFN